MAAPSNCGTGRGVAHGGAGVHWKFGVPLPVPGRYQVPDMYCKTYELVLQCKYHNIVVDKRFCCWTGELLGEMEPLHSEKAAAARAGLFSE